LHAGNVESTLLNAATLAERGVMSPKGKVPYWVAEVAAKGFGKKKYLLAAFFRSKLIFLDMHG